jgi:hypothetical protein
MDTSTSVTVGNEAELSLNLASLAGVPNVQLTFGHYDVADEETAMPTSSWTGHVNGDGISFSGDGGTTWRTLWDAPAAQLTGSWVSYSIDVSAAMAAAGWSFGPNFKLRLQQVDDNPIATDGRGWDNIAITRPGTNVDWYSVALNAGGRYAFATRGAGASVLEIYDEANNLVATQATGGRDIDLTANVDVQTAGRYTVRYVGSGGEYSLSVIENGVFEREANDSRATAQPLDSRPVLGSSQGGTPSAIRMGLIQDTLPWGRSSNNAIATQLGYAVTIIPSSTLGTVNFSAFDMIVVAGDQSTSTYANVQANIGRVETYVAAGGVWAVNAVGGSNYSFGYDILPGAAGVTFSQLWGYDINVVTPSSPLINGPGGIITSATLDNGNQSYGGYTTSPLPVGSTAILSTDVASRVVAFDYGYQGGHVLVNTIPVEYYDAVGNFKVFHTNFFNMGASFVNTTDDDYYSVTLNAGETYTYRTSTPGDGPGQFANTLDPALELQDAAGNVLASDANSGADGRNAVLTFRPSTSGQYFLRLKGTIGSGAYAISTTSVPPLPTAVGGGVNYIDGHGFHITFSEPVDAASVSPADLTVRRVGDATIHAPSRVEVSPDGLKVTWRFDVPLPDGNYQADLAAGAVLGTRGVAMSNAYRIEGADAFFKAGDADRSRGVDFSDLVILAQNYNTASGATWREGDFNFDGRVNFSDLVILAENYRSGLALSQFGALLAGQAATAT